ncbi:MAG: hypothetical protein VXY35_06650, partial [Candidatus Thermoplasmatota archaeon]|nr:hypothetical protein [Candidatus Thermoplasmatota archaeon]
MATVGLAGCVGNDDSDSDDYDVTLVDITSASSNDCPDGGVTIYSGIDDDSDGTLETDERDNTFHTCNGADGNNGADGSAGADGANGADG